MATGKNKKNPKKTQHKKKPTKPGGLREWVSLPATILNKKKQAQLEMQKIQNSLILYRAHSITYDYFATNTDRNLANLYSWIHNEMIKLTSMEADLYFKRFSLKALRTLNTRLDEVISKQKELDQKIHKAPLAFDFYNRMSFFKTRHHQQAQVEREMRRIFSKARNSLNHAQEYFSEYEKEQSGNQNSESILVLESAREFWESKLEEIDQLEKENNDPALVVTDIENLAKIIYDAPTQAKWVDAVEKRFKCLSMDHALLVDTYGKSIIPREIMDEFSDVLYTAVPKLWATGQGETLAQHLNELESFIATYQADVENEIKFTQRHERKETHVSEKAIKLNQLSDIARLFITAMDARDPMMKTHSQTVAYLAVATGKQMNWEQDDILYLEIAALLHDVGKLWIPDSILTKKTKLSQEELSMIRLHPANGAVILQTSGMFKKIIPWVHHHQELWNGSGYPDGLKGEDIPLQARIIGVCESFAAMLSGTPVKSPLTVEQALDRVKMDAGTLFDPVVVDAFVTAVESQEMDFLKKYIEK